MLARLDSRITVPRACQPCGSPKPGRGLSSAQHHQRGHPCLPCRLPRLSLSRTHTTWPGPALSGSPATQSVFALQVVVLLCREAALPFLWNRG